MSLSFGGSLGMVQRLDISIQFQYSLSIKSSTHKIILLRRISLNSTPQDIPIPLLERRARNDDPWPAQSPFLKPPDLIPTVIPLVPAHPFRRGPDQREPREPVVVRQRRPRGHLVDVGLGVQGVAVDEGEGEGVGEVVADSGLAAALSAGHEGRERVVSSRVGAAARG